jgi:5-formyltetrahydrofolate cyclo-ligase
VELAARKRNLRRRLVALRGAVDPGSERAASVAVADAVVETAEFRDAPVVALYAALAGELPTDELFARARAASKRCLFPRCVAGTTLEFAAIDRWEALEPAGRFGLREPPRSLRAEELRAEALVIVPGLAFDLAGNRLGHGRGYYDRRFPADRDGTPYLFGVGFSWQLVEQVPVGQFDRMMDAVVTERGITRPRRSTAKVMRPESGQREEQ